MNFKKFLSDTKNIKNHFIIGDFNLNILDLDTINEDFLFNIFENGFRPCFKGITRPNNDGITGSCIDNIFVKTIEIETNAYKLTHSFTDHYPLLVGLKIATFTNSEENNSFSSANYNKLKKIASRVNWNDLISLDPNITTDLIIDEIKNCINLAKLSNRKSKRKASDIPRKKWITHAIIRSCNTKEQLFKI